MEKASLYSIGKNVNDNTNLFYVFDFDQYPSHSRMILVPKRNLIKPDLISSFILPTNINTIINLNDNYYKEPNKEKENLLSLYEDFLSCFNKNNIHIKNKDLLIKFFSNNSYQINIDVIEEVFSLVNKNFSKFEVVFNFDEEYSSDIQLCIRSNNYKENDISSLISKVENKIIDILDDNNSTINILLYTDYKKTEFSYVLI